MYQPTSPRLIIAKSRIADEAWQRRVDDAKAAERIVEGIEFRVDFGFSLNKAIELCLPKAKRSWAIRAVTAYRKGGFEALIDSRMPIESGFDRRCLDIIQSARMANPKVTVEQVLAILKKRKVGKLPSEATIKREMRKVDDRRRYAEKKKKEGQQKTEGQAVVEELPMAGGELLLAAEIETGLMAQVTDEIVTLGAEARETSGGQQPERDRARRDRAGRFTAEYNHARRRKTGQKVASYMRPAEQKGAAKVPSWPRFVREQRRSLERKVRSLSFEPLVNKGHGWDGLVAEGVAQGLEPLCGVAYMPSTLSKFTSALAQSGAGSRLLMVVGQRWHEVASQCFGEGGAMAALYVDNHVKEVWSSLFTKAGKVSHRPRVMPCITTTYVHTGAGTPIWVALQSGSAPLSPRLAQIVEAAEAQLDEEVHRLVVIDSEGSVFDIFSSFTSAKRVIVTPMRASQAKSLDLSFGPGSYFRPFREHDELRIATATLHHKSSKRSLDLSALIVRRCDGSAEQVLLTNGPQLGVAGRPIAQAYFRRWPVQENSFKSGAAAVKLDHHRGNSAQMVTNVAVVSRLEKVEGQLVEAEARLSEVTGAREAVEQAAEAALRAHEEALMELSRSRSAFDTLRGSESPPAEDLSSAALRFSEDVVREQERRCARDRSEAEQVDNARAREELLGAIERLSSEATALESQQQIRQLDVALDSVLTSFKLVATLLIMFVLRKYLSGRPMTAETFVRRVLTIRGRREVSLDNERIVFYANPRDAEMSSALKSACEVLNRRKLKREGHLLTYRLEEPP